MDPNNYTFTQEGYKEFMKNIRALVWPPSKLKVDFICEEESDEPT